MSGELHVFSNGMDDFVALDLEDLAKVYIEFYGETMEAIDDDPAEFVPIADNLPIKILLDEDSLPFPEEQWPQGARVDRDDTGKITLTAPAGEWARSNGRGFLCSTEY